MFFLAVWESFSPAESYFAGHCSAKSYFARYVEEFSQIWVILILIAFPIFTGLLSINFIMCNNIHVYDIP